MRRYRLTFAWQGLVALLLVQLPNIVWAIWPPRYDPLSLNSTPFPVLDIIENASMVLLMCSLVFIRPKDGVLSQHARPLLLVAAGAIVGYWALWALYYGGLVHPVGLLAMSVLPIVYYVCLSLRVRNTIALPVAVIAAVFHIGITLHNYVL